MGTIERALKTLSKTELASKAGVSLSAVSLIFSGKRRVSVGMLRKLATAIEVPLDDLDRYLQKFPAPKNPPWSGVKPKNGKSPKSVAA
jgi:transcriptional regulator with XRE-family HTH domain